MKFCKLFNSFSIPLFIFLGIGLVEFIISKINMLPNIIKELSDNLRQEKDEIVDLLKDKGTKITTTDIAAMLKKKDIERVKKMCKIMFDDGEIDFAGNNRYFVLNGSEEKSSSDKVNDENSGLDIKSELKKFKDMLDEGLITQDDFDSKKKELLGL